MTPDPHTPDLRAAVPDFVRGINQILRPLAALILRLLDLTAYHHYATPLWARVFRTLNRVERAMARIAAGKTFRPRAPRPARPRAPRTPTGNALAYSPRGQGWISRKLGYQARGYASQLEHLLTQPEGAALLAAAPHLARTLRPLCTLLGIKPATLAWPEPKPRKPRPKPVRAKQPRPPRPPSERERREILAYPNIHNRPMKLLPPKNRRV